jgi:hypothetical protein
MTNASLWENATPEIVRSDLFIKRSAIAPGRNPSKRNVDDLTSVLRGLTDLHGSGSVVALANQVTTHEQTVSTSHGLVEELFDRRVNLKIATASYAMHLKDVTRDRLFSELDFLLSADGWDDEDHLPTIESFRRFLKWIVFTGDETWTSLGIADDGNLLTAWTRGTSRMTANFGKRIRWTQRFEADGEIQLVSGEFSLEHFARQAAIFLSGF